MSISTLCFSACTVYGFYSDPNERLTPAAKTLLNKEGLEVQFHDHKLGPNLSIFAAYGLRGVQISRRGECEEIIAILTLGVIPVVCDNYLKATYNSRQTSMRWESNMGWWFAPLVAMFPGWAFSDSDRSAYVDGAIVHLVNQLAEEPKN